MPKSLTRKAQVVLSTEQYELLEAYAREQGKPLSTVIREYLEQDLLQRLQRRHRQAALDRLTSQQLPVADWKTMKREIEGLWEP